MNSNTKFGVSSYLADAQAASQERDSWRQQYEELRDRKLRDSGHADRQAQVRCCISMLPHHDPRSI